MKILSAAIVDFFLMFGSPLLAFAHETEIPHEEAVPTINPIFAVGIIVAFAVFGLLLWKYVLHKPSTPPVKTETPQNEKKVIK